MKIKIIKDFRTFKEGDVFDFSVIDKLHTITIVGDNGCGKSSLIHALRGYKNDAKTSSLYEDGFEKLAQNIEVEHNYEKMFYLDNVKDNGSDMQVAYDAVNYIQSGGFATKDISHGQGSLHYLVKFIETIKDKIVPNKTLIVLDEIDGGFSLQNMSKTINIVEALWFKYKCDVLIITHNPFLIHDSCMCYDISTKELLPSFKYIKQQTGFKIEKILD